MRASAVPRAAYGAFPTFGQLSSEHVLNGPRRLPGRGRRVLVLLGVIALIITCVGAYVGAIKVLVDSRIRDDRQSPRQGADGAQANRVPSAAPKFSTSDYRQTRFPRTTGRPLLGVNYTHHSFRRCSLNGTGILRTYSNPGVAQKVHAQLYRMRKAGVQTIRTIVWHMTDAAGQSWGAVSSPGGRPGEPYRTNLIRYVSEIRKFGFARLTISFAPQQAGNPLLGAYDPRRFRENWQFIRSIRSLLKRYGPEDTRIDLLNQGAPSEAPSEWTPFPPQTGHYRIGCTACMSISSETGTYPCLLFPGTRLIVCGTWCAS